MTSYNPKYTFPIAFAPQSMTNVLAEYFAKKGVRQCHVAETEKYAHVTFFFNGGVEKQFPLEDRDLVPSPKVATYDLQPEMSAAGVCYTLISRMKDHKHHFLMNNFAPPDMVGHTGVYEAAIKACEATDIAIGKVYQACLEEGYTLFVTSDHGNAEEMQNEEGKPKTSHTTNKVPFVMANAPLKWTLRKEGGVLGDVAPTVLDCMGLDKPEEMGGKSLLVKDQSS